MADNNYPHYKIDKYEVLQGFLDHHKHSPDSKLLVVFGPPGVGKSHEASRLVGKENSLKGRVTPIKAYTHLYARKNQELLLLDDCRSLFQDKYGVELLMQVTDSKRKNPVRWDTARSPKALGKVPPAFLSSSRLIVLNNSSAVFGDDIHALADRGLVVHFNPDPPEVLERARTYFPGLDEHARSIFAFVEQHLSRIVSLSLRDLEKARQVARTASHHDLDWRKLIETSCFAADRTLTVLDIVQDEGLRTPAAKIAAYQKRTGASRATFYRDLEALRLSPPSEPPPAPSDEIQGDYVPDDEDDLDDPEEDPPDPKGLPAGVSFEDILNA